MSQSWNESVPQAKAWKPRAGMSQVVRAAEQDRASGGRESRVILLPEGRTAHASVALRLPARHRRIRAYLRWSDAGKTKEKYVGEVDRDSRAANLVAAWEIIGQRQLLHHLVHAAEPKPELGPREATAASSWASSPATRAVMRANRSRDTRPERALRSYLHGHGLRYRVDTRPVAAIRRRADVVFTVARVAVFVDGCFWHGCPEHYRKSRKNELFWAEKIAGNKARDIETDELLRTAGWTVVRIWEHEDVEIAGPQVIKIVQERREVQRRI